MQPAALGFRVHSGWAAAVAISLSKSAPMVLDRRRVQLVKTFSYTFRQPYHTAEKMPLADAAKFIGDVQAEARKLSLSSLLEIQKTLAPAGFRITRCALLLASGHPLPELDRILASHALIHTADGELFREAITHASARCRISLLSIKERDLFALAAKSLRAGPDVLRGRVTDLGRSVGSPWSQDEKFSALAAWLALRIRVFGTCA